MNALHFAHPTSARQRQHGVMLIELASCLFGVIMFLALTFQLGRQIYYYQVLLTATNSAALYLASAPDSELQTSAKQKAGQIIKLTLQNSGMENAASVTTSYACVPMVAAPCGSSGMATKMAVKAVYTLNDTLLGMYTYSLENGGIDINSIYISAQTTMPRAGYY
jgi:hypothetical protein